jgi:nanoRNase/pAp phosphatase (c-di-AMP/oligoRNAs hydrolase)
MSEKGKVKAADFENLSLQLKEILKKYPRLLIYIKGSPDPDAIASSYALKLLCEKVGTDAMIVCPKEPSLPQNIKIIKDLHLPIRFKEVEDCKKHYDAYAVPDHQSVFVEGVTGVIPCALHIDHHEPAREEIPVDLRVLIDEAGSTSTILILLVNAMGPDYDTPSWRDAATAFYYGIQTDTDNFQHAGHLDYKALELISPFTDKTLLDQISTLPFTKEAVHLFHQALREMILYKDWLISGIGFIEQKHRDTLGIIGDFLLKREGIKVVVIFAIVEKDNQLTLDASFRTKDEDLNLNALIKKITREGGARKFKGAFQVNLDYFANCPDRDLLWQMVYTTTIETLKKQRGAVHAFELQKLFGTLKNKILDMFR